MVNAILTLASAALASFAGAASVAKRGDQNKCFLAAHELSLDRTFAFSLVIACVNSLPAVKDGYWNDMLCVAAAVAGGVRSLTIQIVPLSDIINRRAKP